MKRKLFFVFLFTSFYAVVRYHVFGPVLFKDLFLFTFNKVIAFSALILWVWNLWPGNNKEKEKLKNIILFLISLHIILSVILLRPYYFPDFFIPLKGFSLFGSLALLGGSLAAVLMFFSGKISFRFNIKYLFFFFIAIHLVSMGGKGWLTPIKWYGYLPPITLISFLILLAGSIKRK
jgi:hypothetical protein